MKQTKKILVTGAAGLIGSEAVKFFCERDYQVIGIDNNLRQYFLGKIASTEWNKRKLEDSYKNYQHFSIDIRDQQAVERIFQKNQLDLIIHAAAQPSHDWAAKEPITDFTINALATLYLLELTRKYHPQAVFIFTSTNKVYGDLPNQLPVKELTTRWELPQNHRYYPGIDETMSIDQSKHSLFGASKVAADILVQEYGRYFGMKTVVFRGGCLTGSAHSGAKLHGFLAYLVRCIAKGETYTIIGYKGKQVRDNIHSSDLIKAFYEFYKKPRKGEVYNIGGGRFANCSILEAISKAEKILHKKAKVKFLSTPRSGDHIWYISNVAKFQSHYPNWQYTYDIDMIIEDICHFGHLV